MSKSTHIDMENLKPPQKLSPDDFPTRKAAFEHLLERLDSINERIEELQTLASGLPNYSIDDLQVVQNKIRIFRSLEKQNKRIKVLEAEANK